MNLVIYLVSTLVGFAAILIVSAFIFIKTAPQFGASPDEVEMEKIRQSKNFKNGIFVNLIKTELDMDLSKLGGIMRDFLFLRGLKPKGKVPSEFEGGYDGGDSLAYLTWFGHSAILLEIDGKKIFLDPMLGSHASPVSFVTTRFPYQDPIDFEEIPALDAVIFSHDHYDHLDYESVIKLKDRTKKFFVPLAVGAHLRRWGVPKDKIVEMDWWDETTFEGLSLACTPSRHFSGRGFADRNSTLWASWVIRGKNQNVYFSGDSGYGPHFKEIGEKYGPFDFSMLECGQYNMQWHDIHMLPEETVQAGIDAKSRMIMPIHWGAFNLALHTWRDPVIRAKAEAKIKGIPLVSPKIGDRFAIGENPLNQNWWN